MARARRHIPMLVWLGVSALLHSGTLGGVREVALRVMRASPPPRVAMGSSSIEVEFEPADAVHPTPTPATPVPPPVPTPDPTAHAEAPHVRAASEAHTVPTPATEVPPPPPPPPPTPVRAPVVARVAPPPPDQAQQWANQAQGNNQSSPDGMLAQADNRVTEQSVRRSEEHAAERHVEGSEALNSPGNPSPRPPEHPTPRPPRETPSRAPRLAANTPPPPVPARAPPAPAPSRQEAGARSGASGAAGRPGDGRAPGREGAAGPLAAAGATTRAVEAPGLTTGSGGTTGIGETRGEGGAGGVRGTGGDGGNHGRGGQDGASTQPGTGGSGNDAARRLGIQGLGAARALMSLSPSFQTFDAVYNRELREQWRRDDERRRAEARGDYASNWRQALAAIETPVTVRPGETTALNTRASPFAAYIVQLHDRVHEAFADGFIARLGHLPSESPLQNGALHTVLEIVVNPDGSIHRMAVAQASGVLAFDVGAIDAVRAAGPFPAPPEVIRSGDTRVYMHWHFRRENNFCNDVRPYILRGHAPVAPEPPTPAAPLRDREGDVHDGGVQDGGAPDASSPSRGPSMPDYPGVQRAV